jgi:NAD(P)-dependent dehydrogenase (short-subunit alcohol dehydrogenase family)
MSENSIDRSTAPPGALAGRVAVVTGGGQGIGLETARVLAHLGAAVGILEIIERGREVVARITADGGTACAVQVDVADPVALRAAIATVVAALGPVDILVNNAALFTVKPLVEHTVAEWDRVMAVNLRGAFVAITEVLPAMVERGRGVIVTMESAEAMPYLTPYLTTKAGLRSLALSLAEELDGTGVSAYCFGAGIVDTPGLRQAFESLAPRLGMSVTDFAAQAGLSMVPAELCATGLAGTILHADQLSGQETGYVEGLRLLGLDAAGRPLPAAPARGPAADAEPSSGGDLLAANRAVESFLAEHETELEQVPAFVRPFALRAVKRATGMGLADLRGRAAEMSAQLSTDQELRPAAMDGYAGLLQRLLAYLEKQEADASGWFKDEQTLQAALEAIRARQAAVRAVLDTLPKEPAALA